MRDCERGMYGIAVQLVIHVGNPLVDRKPV